MLIHQPVDFFLLEPFSSLDHLLHRLFVLPLELDYLILEREAVLEIPLTLLVELVVLFFDGVQI